VNIEKPTRIEAGKYEYHGFTIERATNIRGCPWIVKGRGLGWQPCYKTILRAWQEIRYWEHTFSRGGRLSPATAKAFAEVKTIKLPPSFYEDHLERDLPTPEDVGNAKSYVVIRADDPALPELLDDAEHYAHPWGPDAEGLSGLKASARATVRAIRDVLGWDDAEPEILRLRKAVS
jgi:hypothetical protein